MNLARESCGNLLSPGWLDCLHADPHHRTDAVFTTPDATMDEDVGFNRHTSDALFLREKQSRLEPHDKSRVLLYLLFFSLHCIHRQRRSLFIP